MKLNLIRANMTEVELSDGGRVLFNYNTPVAALIKEGATFHQYRTDKKWSATTTRHINTWNPLGGAYGIKPQAFFDTLVP